MKTLLLYLTPFLLTALLIIACQKQDLEILEPYEPSNHFEHDAGYRCVDCSCFQVKVAKNFIKDYLIYLQDKGIAVSDPNALLDIARTSVQRVQLSESCGLDSLVLTQMVELVDLMGIGLTEIEAQILMCAHGNEMNIFTGSVMNLRRLKASNPENLLINVQGFLSGQHDYKIPSDILSYEDNLEWIRKLH